jgi:hypothetical protein
MTVASGIEVQPFAGTWTKLIHASGVEEVAMLQRTLTLDRGDVKEQIEIRIEQPVRRAMSVLVT